jgi:hypothetical protein
MDMNFGGTLLRWWPVIMAFAGMMWYVSKSIADLKGHNDKQDAWIDENTKKITSLFELHNETVKRRLDKLDRIENEDHEKVNSRN